MRTKIFLILILLMAPFANAADMCSAIFEGALLNDSATDIPVRPRHARFFTVRNYNRLVGSELDRFLKSFKNLTQISEKLEQLYYFVPHLDRAIPSEAYFIANELVPYLQTYLNTHKVNYKIETYLKSKDEKKSLIIILPDGDNQLNVLAKELSVQKMELAIDPLLLFFGSVHYNENEGRVIDIGFDRTAYALSFRLVLHSQRKGFIPEFSRDKDLKEVLREIQFEQSFKIKKATE